MSNLTFKETISLAREIYKRSFKLTFILAFMLSFISEYCFVYLIKYGILEYIGSNGKQIPANFPSSSILTLIMLVIFLSTIFVYAMIILLQSILIKQDMKNYDVLKLSFQVFSKRIFIFIGALFSLIIAMSILSILSIFLQYMGKLLVILLFFTVLPTVLLEQKNVFEAIKENFVILKANFSYMMKLTLIVFALMLIKPFLNFVVACLLTSIDIAVTPLEMSIENIFVIVVDSLMIMYMFSIIVATFLATRKEKLIS